ncbi:uncharacterized protein F4807DRAFT_457529 [Annulohypoxylon truncatum]|uniref:uncharacterized protein n=1 Tax=Annulohypoxylon truncatum TaxID=327061 RepID=UPI002008278C|nr:uncharacterized protein F4807DRAFT_457529 [Annulohypoxylon truncatum]KAI1212730.1 hypothetical protein F4807DRAFT_457529 [Annulohypoxylon truncatum]
MTTAVTATKERIHKSLIGEFQFSSFSNKKFVPDKRAKGLLTNDILTQILSEGGKGYRDTIFGRRNGKQSSDSSNSELVRYIEDHATRVFATLLLSGHVERAVKLRKYGFMDKYLPVQIHDDQVTSFHLLADDKALKWFEGWSSQELASFDTFQWHFLAPVFTSRSILEQPHDMCPLPFTSYGDDEDGGSFGKIYQARIHHDHIEGLQLNEDFTVAIKEIRATHVPDRTYEVEMDALELARWLEDDHLVKFIAGFEMTGKHYLMFQWVNGGNLRSYWESFQGLRDGELIKRTLKQIEGIANALGKMHNVDPEKNCRHGDLKPENILVSERSNNEIFLQITDMGSAKIHSVPTSLRQIGTTSLAGTLRYQPPEVRTSRRRSRAYDIWSMGCILLEFIVWFLYGWDGLSEFNKSFDHTTQPFFRIGIGEERCILQPNVDKWIKHLQRTCLVDSHDKCVSRALRKLLDFVCTEILVENDEAENDMIIDNGPQSSLGHRLPRIILERAATRKRDGLQQQRAGISKVSAMLAEICSEDGANYFYNNKAAASEDSKHILRSDELKKELKLQPPTYHLDIGPPQQQIASPEHWLNDCDSKHGKTCKALNTTMKRPTRLIDVGDVLSKTLKLDCNPEDKPYIALSHPWGDEESNPRFCTTKSNIDIYKNSIGLDQLPETFRDAVLVTQNLHVKYLWIDSLCILQGEAEDFHIESQFMEDYYSGAYCTISATSATGSSSGFLKERPTNGGNVRECHMLQIQNEPSGPKSTFYICKSIDDFDRDVEKSSLSRRGWVFQERALSRRTIHFTDTQTYWECGHGVRCETMNRLFNRQSSFLSDPNFPNSTIGYQKGMRIKFFQYIYSKYSALGFSYETDRSVAMFGLEKRLARTYKVRARYGILDDEFLHRSLLWQKAEEPLRKIEFGRNNDKVPSWSWMAVMGSIKYMDAPFDLMEWNEGEIKSPLKGDLKEVNRVWTQPVSDFIVPARSVSQEVNPKDLFYDRPEYEVNDESINDNLKCVIIGWDKIEQQNKDFYALLVIPTGASRDGYPDYERIGVARMTGTDFEKDETRVRIV